MIYLIYGGNTGGWRWAFHRQLGAAGLSITGITAWKLNLSSFSKIPRLTSRVDCQYIWKNFRPSAASWWISSILHVDTKLMVYALPSLQQAEIRKMGEWWKCRKCQNPYCYKTIPMSIRAYCTMTRSQINRGNPPIIECFVIWDAKTLIWCHFHRRCDVSAAVAPMLNIWH